MKAAAVFPGVIKAGRNQTLAAREQEGTNSARKDIKSGQITVERWVDFYLGRPASCRVMVIVSMWTVEL